jgi:hypothetical protein
MFRRRYVKGKNNLEAANKQKAGSSFLDVFLAWSEK